MAKGRGVIIRSAPSRRHDAAHRRVTVSRGPAARPKAGRQEQNALTAMLPFASAFLAIPGRTAPGFAPAPPVELTLTERCSPAGHGLAVAKARHEEGSFCWRGSNPHEATPAGPREQLATRAHLSGTQERRYQTPCGSYRRGFSAKRRLFPARGARGGPGVTLLLKSRGRSIRPGAAGATAGSGAIGPTSWRGTSTP